MTDDTNDKDRALSEIRSDIESTRERLSETLDAIEDRLDVPKRAKKAFAEGRAVAVQAVSDGRTWFETQRRDNPAIVYGVLGGAGALVVGVGVLIARGGRR
ncbi:DUF3618 domain-containing protein [uncultured Amnibacterium sp.]|uniref:DUF3618 domain-containing protein n=1 Tax=uncultured Amnibacterium sp. TaxID=1631851 RepID=UPI0035C97D14